MQEHPSEQRRRARELSHRVTLMEPPVSMGILSCAVVGMTHWLGAPWVAEPWLGLPLGVWVVGAVVGMTHLSARKRGAPAASTAAPDHVVDAPSEPPTPFRWSLPSLDWQGAGASVAGVFRSVFSHPLYASAVERESRRSRSEFEQRSDATLRIALSGPEDQRERALDVIKNEIESTASWRNPPDLIAGPEACARQGWDASVRIDGSGNASVVLPEVDGRGAAWVDWSKRLALSYPAVFPPRVDASRIACGRLDVRSTRELRLIARLAEANALLARTEPRTKANSRYGKPVAGIDAVSGAMIELARTLAADWAGEAGPMPSICKVAARGVSAWLTMWDGEIDTQERRRWVEVCATILPDEPESHLRVAAARVGAYEDEQAMPALTRAFELLRESGEVPLTDPLAFIMAEMEVGGPNSMALGRVAAGLALVWATTSRESLDYLRDDLIEDLRFAGKLVGRDQDHAFLRSVIARMDALRADTLPLKNKAA